jgi:hypothetical protein
MYFKATYFDPREYEKGIKVPDREFKRLNITKSKNLGNWNYTIAPRSISTEKPHMSSFLSTEHATELRAASRCP